MRLRLGGVVAAALLAMTAAAGAATVDLDYGTYNRGKLARAQTDMADFKAALPSGFRTEGFEGYQPWGKGKGTQNLRHTAVGSFTPFGKTGGGDAVVGDGSQAAGARRQPHALGPLQRPTASAGRSRGNWLDSNDNRGIKWRIKDVGKFDTIGFFVSDVADVGGKFSIKVGDTVYRDIADGAKLRNGNIHFVRILLVRGGGQADDQAQPRHRRRRLRRRRRWWSATLGAGPAAAGRGAAADRPPRPLRPAPARPAAPPERGRPGFRRRGPRPLPLRALLPGLRPAAARSGGRRAAAPAARSCRSGWRGRRSRRRSSRRYRGSPTPCTRQSRSTTPSRGSSAIRVVPMWCQPPTIVLGDAGKAGGSASSQSRIRTRPIPCSATCIAERLGRRADGVDVERAEPPVEHHPRHPEGVALASPSRTRLSRSSACSLAISTQPACGAGAPPRASQAPSPSRPQPGGRPSTRSASAARKSAEQARLRAAALPRPSGGGGASA